MILCFLVISGQGLIIIKIIENCPGRCPVICNLHPLFVVFLSYGLFLLPFAPMCLEFWEYGLITAAFSFLRMSQLSRSYDLGWSVPWNSTRHLQSWKLSSLILIFFGEPKWKGYCRLSRRSFANGPQNIRKLTISYLKYSQCKHTGTHFLASKNNINQNKTVKWQGYWWLRWQ